MDTYRPHWKMYFVKHIVMLDLSNIFLHERGGFHSPVSNALLPHPRNQRFQEIEL